MNSAVLDMNSTVLDANVLYSSMLRDFLLWLAADDVFTPFWSEEIQNEWTRKALENCPNVTPEKLARTCQNMNTHFPEGCVRGYEFITPMPQLPDPNDQHVLAVAIHIKAKYIVTFNLDDFPQTILQSHGIGVLSPDDFAVRVIREDPDAAFVAIRIHRSGLKNPPMTADEYITMIEQQRLPETAKFLREHKGDI